ncbi:hypothetical protein C8F01DRAFT_1249396 [Mycena amicta]|nr:hypothetical protein C8F01DRAFT_1249396 [Mycena amicta]
MSTTLTLPPRPRRRRILRHYSEMVYVGTKPTFKRLARRGGVKRMAGGVYEESRAVLYPHLKELVRTTVLYATHSHRRTVKQEDVRRALGMQGVNMYT